MMIIVIEHIIQDGSEFDGETEWRVYVSYEEGKRLFSPESLSSDSFPYPHSSWYSIPTDCWAFQWNDAGEEYDYWWTMNEELAKYAIEKYEWEVTIK